ncbi:MAG: hypothetical protein ACJ8AS_03170 [Hyphomicrobiales bacterium]
MRHLRAHLSYGAAAILAGMLTLAHGTAAEAACKLNSAEGKIKRVIYLTFDNVHLRRDDPNVPSDLEQMPTLLNFLLDNGTVSGNHHTALISHTATGILTALTGLYGERMGVPVSNSYGFFRPDGSVGFTSSFLYWTALGGDGKPNMIDENGKTAPAPWVPFTRAGCDVGGFSVANIELERVPDDVTTFFGEGSKEDKRVKAALALPDTPGNQAARTKPTTDFLGIAIHCAKGSALCSNQHAKPDPLPDERGGYVGYKGLFGNVNVQPVISPTGPVKDINGNDVQDAYGQPGFPNVFNPTAAQSLGYAATMLEAGVPVVYVYVVDVHERNPRPLDPVTNKPSPNRAFGPGEAEYVAQLRAYDQAFGKFFTRLAADGITKANTLFVVVPDENDHFVGSKPSPAGCDGVNVACTYTAAAEINAHLNRVLLTQTGNSTPFAIHSDSAPTIYINGEPDATAAVTRQMEHDLDALVGLNPITGKTDKLSKYLADEAEMKFLHMVTSSPDRTPTMTMFGDNDYFFSNVSSLTPCTQDPPCLSVPQPPQATFAWNHGDIQRDITRAWLAMVGPGVKDEGRDDRVFSDHTDVRPTMMALLGLQDSYVHDGRILIEKLTRGALPVPLGVPSEQYAELGAAYKQLNAPLGALGRSSVVAANRAVTGGDNGYNRYLKAMAKLTAGRDAVASQMKAILNRSVTSSRSAVASRNASDLLNRAVELMQQMRRLATGSISAERS